MKSVFEGIVELSAACIKVSEFGLDSTKRSVVAFERESQRSGSGVHAMGPSSSFCSSLFQPKARAIPHMSKQSKSTSAMKMIKTRNILYCSREYPTVTQFSIRRRLENAVAVDG
jgi:hypothetical protein